MSTATNEDLYRKIKSLNELLWEHRVAHPVVAQWLCNFRGDFEAMDTERSNALYLLSKFLFLGRNEVRQLLRAMFVDLIRQPLTLEARAQLEIQDNFDAIHRGFLSKFEGTRFLGLGNPAESGTHILYDFRHMNKIPLRYFVAPHELFTGGLNDPETEWESPSVDRLIFIDDFCGTGTQAQNMGVKYVPLMREVARRSNIDVKVWYLTLLATTAGLEFLRKAEIFDRVECVSQLDSSYRVFDDDSLYYIRPPSNVTKIQAEGIARGYGKRLQPGSPLGFDDCQLLIGFHHNVPDNTLPIISHERPELPWYPVFPRDEKY